MYIHIYILKRRYVDIQNRNFKLKRILNYYLYRFKYGKQNLYD